MLIGNSFVIITGVYNYFMYICRENAYIATTYNRYIHINVFFWSKYQLT